MSVISMDLFNNLNPPGKKADIEVIYSGDKNKVKVVGRFAPKANPEYHLSSGEAELMTVIATDVLAEGLNLQDCDNIVNYDLHWNPVKLIQRFGRIDRVGLDYDVIYGFNFLPEIGIERNLGLKQKLHNRIQEIHDTIGENSAILDRSEMLNEEAIYAIYEKRGGQLSLFDVEESELLDINEAEELLRQLKKERPEEYERISNLRDGIRAVKPSDTKGTYAFYQAGRYQQLFLLDENGDIIIRDIPRVLGGIKCGPELEGRPIPKGYNSIIMRIKRQFTEEVKHRQAERGYTPSLTQGQRYVLRELRVMFNATEDDNLKAQMNILEAAFRRTLTRALNRELNKIRRNGITGEALLKNLGRLYYQHNMRDWADRKGIFPEEPSIPMVICSEGLM
jgi:superfamily II DNA/RNA helicase